jgi:hypothetical protein
MSMVEVFRTDRGDYVIDGDPDTGYRLRRLGDPQGRFTRKSHARTALAALSAPGGVPVERSAGRFPLSPSAGTTGTASTTGGAS